MDPQIVADDEARRLLQHESVKGRLGDGVHAHIANESEANTPAEQAQMASVAAGLKHNAAAELAETEEDIRRARRMTRVSQVGEYVFFLIYGLIGLEIILQLLGARQASGFKRVLDGITSPLLGPFRGLMPEPALGPMQLKLSYVVALVVYVLLHVAFNGMLRLFAQRKASI